ncbi:MAG TPA: YbfB/YjiJ family MFS transporter, partial [Alphaproteobacteria bacterium]|nr:YbfB/YjiJ family MFS transporter [Alphaproteobacteria bacterium]
MAGLGTLALMAGGISSAAAWQVFGAGTLAVAVAVCMLTGSEFPEARPARRKQAMPRTPLPWGAVIAYGATGIGYVIPATYLPVMARETVSSPLVFGWGWPLFGAAAFLSTLLSARLHAAYSNRQVWAASQAVMASGLLLPAVYPNIVTVIAGGLCVGGTFMIITMAGMKEAHRIASVHDVQRHIAALTAAFATGQIVGPVLAGWLYEATESFASPLFITSVTLAGPIVVLARRSALPRSA